MKKILIMITVILALTVFSLQHQVRDAFVQTEVQTANFGTIGIIKIELQENQDSSHLRIFCDADTKLPLSDFESVSGDVIGFSPLPGNSFVIHIISEEKPRFLETISIPIRNKISKEVLDLTTRFWPENVSQG